MRGQDTTYLRQGFKLGHAVQKGDKRTQALNTFGEHSFFKKSISNNSNVYYFNTLPTPVSTFSSTFAWRRPKCPFAFPRERRAKGPFGICRPRLRVRPTGPRQGLSGALPPLPGLLPLLLPCCPLLGLSFPTHNLLPAPGPGLGSWHTVRRLAWHRQAIPQTRVCRDGPRPLRTPELTHHPVLRHRRPMSRPRNGNGAGRSTRPCGAWQGGVNWKNSTLVINTKPGEVAWGAR